MWSAGMYPRPTKRSMMHPFVGRGLAPAAEIPVYDAVRSVGPGRWTDAVGGDVSPPYETVNDAPLRRAGACPRRRDPGVRRCAFGRTGAEDRRGRRGCIPALRMPMIVPLRSLNDRTLRRAGLLGTDKKFCRKFEKKYELFLN